MSKVNNDDIGNDISALMDNEWLGQGSGRSADVSAAADALLQAVHGDDDARQKWARYHLIRDVMQNDYTAGHGGTLSAGFAASVASAIEAEPAIVAFPSSDQQKQGESPAQSIPYAELDSEPDQPAHNWRRSALGLAVAASVAVVSVVGLNVWQGNDAGPETLVATPNPALQGLSAGTPQLELVVNRGTYWQSSGSRTLSKQNEDKLNMFLSQHIEHAPTTHTGMIPYSRLVGYDKVRGE